MVRRALLAIFVIATLVGLGLAISELLRTHPYIYDVF